MSSTDCVASEHCDNVRLRNFANNQVKHIIGMRQTASTQVSVLICFKFCSGRKGLDLSPPSFRTEHMFCLCFAVLPFGIKIM